MQVLTDPAGQVVVPLLQDQLLSPGPGWLQERIGAGAGSRAKAVAAFQKGMRACLQRVVGLKVRPCLGLGSRSRSRLLLCARRPRPARDTTLNDLKRPLHV